MRGNVLALHVVFTTSSAYTRIQMHPVRLTMYVLVTIRSHLFRNLWVHRKSLYYVKATRQLTILIWKTIIKGGTIDPFWGLLQATLNFNLDFFHVLRFKFRDKC